MPELAVQALNNIRGVYDPPNFQRIFKERVQNFPVFLPALDAGGILSPPALTEGQKIFLRLVQCHGGVDLIHIRNYLLDILVADIAGGGSNLVYDAALKRLFGNTASMARIIPHSPSVQNR